MTVTVTDPLATPVVSAVTLVAGGSLPQNTTYYFIVVAENKSFMFTDQLTSAPSAEGTFTTDTVNKSCKIDWGTVTGATRYHVYLTTTSGLYDGNRRITIVGSYYDGYTTAGTTYTILGTELSVGVVPGVNGPSHISVSQQVIPLGISKAVGKIGISFTGITTLKNIYDAVVAAGYGSNIYWDGNIFGLYGFIVPTGTTASSMTVYDTTIYIIHGGIGNHNVNCTMTFGALTTTGAKSYGTYPCTFVIYTSYEAGVDSTSTGAIRFNGCVFNKVSSITGILTELWIWGQNPAISVTSVITLVDCRSNGLTISDKVGASDISVYSYTYSVLSPSGGNFYRPTIYNSYITPYISISAPNHIYSPIIYRGATYDGVGFEIRNLYYNYYPTVFHNASFPGKASNIPCVQWWWGTAGVTYYSMYFTLDLKVQDTSGNAVVGATVRIRNVSGAEISGSPLTTDANGNIAQIDIYGYRMDADGAYGANYNSIITNYSPHTVTISKSGYVTKTIKYTMDRKREEIETLENRREV